MRRADAIGPKPRPCRRTCCSSARGRGRGLSGGGQASDRAGREPCSDPSGVRLRGRSAGGATAGRLSQSPVPRSRFARRSSVANWPRCSAPPGPIGRRTNCGESGSRSILSAINYYLRLVVRDDPTGGPSPGPRSCTPPNCPQTAMGWEIYPQGLTDILQWVKKRYGDLPLYITENGAAFDDDLQLPNGSIDDIRRVQYLRDHLRAAARPSRRASTCAVTSSGRCWTTSSGNAATRSGLASCHVDFETQRRVPKSSARFYCERDSHQRQ